MVHKKGLRLSVRVSMKQRLKEITVDNIIWWMNLTPQWAGFSILTHDNSVQFWIMLFALISYMNFLSNFVIRIKLSENVAGIVEANTSLTIVLFTVNTSYWFLTKRSLLISTIEKVKLIEKLSTKTEFQLQKHEKLLKNIKIFVLIYYVVNFTNIFLVWIPQRMDLSSSFYTSNPCPGIDVSTEVNKYICRAIVFAQDVLISVVVINFQNLLLFLIAYTAAMYNLMSEEMVALKVYKNTTVGRAHLADKLSILIEQHGLLLDMVQRLRALYNLPIGVNFGTNAYCICLFFFLPLEAWASFAPLIGYCFLVFFLYCYLCQKLINSSLVFENAVYDCGWEDYSVSDKKTILIVLKVAQRPVLLLAGDMVAVNILTFANGMQFIYKFVTALKF